MKSKFLLLKILFIVLASGSLGVYLFLQFGISKIKPHINENFREINLAEERPFEQLLLSPEFEKEIEGKKIIGFGEATHGTREFRESFSKLAKELIIKEKYNTIIFAEQDFGDSWLLNEYVINDAISEFPSHITLSSSALELIKWVKDINTSKPGDEKIWVTSADMYSPRTASLNALSYFKEVGISIPHKSMELLKDVAFSPVLFNIFLEKYTRDSISTLLEPVDKLIQDAEFANRNLSLRNKWKIQSIKSIEKSIKHLLNNHDLKSGLRDSIIFDNISWIMKQRKGPKVFIFAHNAHIEKVEGNTLSKNRGRLGWMLSKRFSKEYYVIGTEAEKGRYTSSIDGNVFSVPRSITKIGSIIGKSVSPESGLLLLNQSIKVKKFFNRDRFITYGVVDTDKPTYPKMRNTSEAFDALFWIRESNPLPFSAGSGFNIVTTLSKKLDPDIFASQNLSVSFNTQYSIKTGNNLYDTPTLGVIEYSKSKFNNYWTMILPHSVDTLNVINHNLTLNTDSLVLFIAGHGTKSLRLSGLTVNDQKIKNNKLMYSAINFQKENGKDNEFSLILNSQIDD